jgi:hypothetical protein
LIAFWNPDIATLSRLTFVHHILIDCTFQLGVTVDVHNQSAAGGVINLPVAGSYNTSQAPILIGSVLIHNALFISALYWLFHCNGDTKLSFKACATLTQLSLA